MALALPYRGAVLDVDEFITNGFVVVEEAIDRRLANAVAQRVWADLSVDPSDSSTWTAPAARTHPTGPALRTAATSERLTRAIDAVAGVGGWQPRQDMGLFIARFPAGVDSHDTGWHIDSSFHPEDKPWPEEWDKWSINVFSRGRALLLLALWSEVSEDDAPTRIRAGSHVDTARALLPAGAAGVAGVDSAPLMDASAERPVVLATGQPGDVYLCHPFLVHAAQPHDGNRARLISQPAIEPSRPWSLDPSGPPAERAIALAVTGSRRGE